MDMNDLYKGYVLTDGKVPIKCKLRDASTYLTIDKINAIGPESYAGVLADDVVLVDFDNMDEAEIALDVVSDNQVNCVVMKTTRGMHFLFKASKQFDKAFTKKRLALGLHADVKLGRKYGLQCLRFDGADREIIYSTNTIDEAPVYFHPVNSKQDPVFVGLTEGSRNDALYNYIPVLFNAMDKSAVKETVSVINKYVFAESLDDAEIATLLRDEVFSKLESSEKTGVVSDDMMATYDSNTISDITNEDDVVEKEMGCAVMNYFFEKAPYKGRFRHDEFARYFYEHEHIIKLGTDESKRIAIYNDGVYVTSEDAIHASMCEYIPGLTLAQRKEVMNYLKSVVLQRGAKDMQPALDGFSDYIAFRNGLFDLKNEELIPFTPDIVVMNKIDWDFDASAYSSLVDGFLDKLVDGDREIRDILEEMIGYTFYRRNEMAKSFIIVGPQSNGKSTFQTMLMQLLGDRNVSTVDLKDFGSKFANAEIADKLANIGDDISDGYIDDNSAFKTIVSGGTYQAERKSKDPFKLKPYAKCIFSANNIPRTRDKSGAIKRRLVIIPFEHVFSNKSADFDPFFINKIAHGDGDCTADDNMSYLINLGIAGLMRVLKHRGFSHSAAVDAKLEEYDEANNPVKVFYREYAESKGVASFQNAISADHVTVNELYEQYKSFCDDYNNKSMSKQEFRKALASDQNVTVKVVRVDNNTTKRVCVVND